MSDTESLRQIQADPSTAKVKPSDIIIAGGVPLCDVFDRAEAEQMAALMIVTLAAAGDEWRPVTQQDINEFVSGVLSESKPPSWIANPFFKPDPSDLVSRGYAERIGKGPEIAIAFTPDGLEKLFASSWVRQAQSGMTDRGVVSDRIVAIRSGRRFDPYTQLPIDDDT